ncbi:MAG TPA: hypothetical protein VNO14_15720, partial [Blastocatellia bacterium]|nr:hypothetical protein [Blastocatellia bacterium]
MAGEDTTIHIVAVGQVGRPASIFCVPDPRRRDDQGTLFNHIAALINPYFESCLRAATYPQLWVTSSAAATHIDVLADRLRYNRHDEILKRLGDNLTYLTTRFRHEGQLSLLAATQALSMHWATGQDSGEDEHLLALLTWINPPEGRPLLDVVAEAEAVPMGVNTDPEFDSGVLAPLVDRYNALVERKASATELASIAKKIEQNLKPVVSRIYDTIQRAITILVAAELPLLPDLGELERREAEEFSSYKAYCSRGYSIPMRDRPRRAAFVLAAREDSLENYEAAVLIGDRVARAQGRLKGDVVVGKVTKPQRLREGLRRFTYRFNLRSQQEVLRIRIRDELFWADDPRLRVIVTSVQRYDWGTEISLEILKGQRAVGLPREGTLVELVKSVPDWERLGRERGHLRKRLAQTPWTHSTGTVPQVAPRRAPEDQLSLVEALR